MATTIRCPLCIYQQHCGHQATLGPPTPGMSGTTLQRSITCLECGATGVKSERIGVKSERIGDA